MSWCCPLLRLAAACARLGLCHRSPDFMGPTTAGCGSCRASTGASTSSATPPLCRASVDTRLVDGLGRGWQLADRRVPTARGHEVAARRCAAGRRASGRLVPAATPSAEPFDGVARWRRPCLAPRTASSAFSLAWLDRRGRSPGRHRRDALSPSGTRSPIPDPPGFLELRDAPDLTRASDVIEKQPAVPDPTAPATAWPSLPPRGAWLTTRRAAVRARRPPVRRFGFGAIGCPARATPRASATWRMLCGSSGGSSSASSR